MKSELESTEVVILDFQTTGAAPGSGHLLEVAWCYRRAASDEPGEDDVFHFIVSLPPGEKVPPRITRITGISEDIMGHSLNPEEIFQLLKSAMRRGPSVAHYARFEQKWINELFSRFSDEEEAPGIICTNELARRLYPGLPRKGIRALSGFLNYSMKENRRAEGHVLATAAIWRRMIPALARMGISTFEHLEEFLRTPYKRSSRWEYALPRDRRLALPDVPGVYRLLSGNGKTLYVGKASSLKKRVNSYFTKRKADEKTLELVSQVHDVSVHETATALEAALLEFDLIREIEPPYNIALRGRESGPVFLSRDLTLRESTPGDDFPFGPLRERSSALFLGNLIRVINGTLLCEPSDLGLDYLPLEEGALESGISMFAEESRLELPVFSHTILRLGCDLRREILECPGGVKSEEEEEPACVSESVKILGPGNVHNHLRWIVTSGTADILTSAWFCVLAWSTIHWRPRAAGGLRFISLESGRTAGEGWNGSLSDVPRAPEKRMNRQRNLRQFELDRLRVVNSELRRIASCGLLHGITLPNGRHLSGKLVGGMLRTV